DGMATNLPVRHVHDLLTPAPYDKRTERYGKFSRQCVYGRVASPSARSTGMEGEWMNAEQREQPDYMSYLMRMWRVPADGDHTWRVSLEEPLTQEVQGFKDLQSLFAFLLAQTGQAKSAGGNVKQTRET